MNQILKLMAKVITGLFLVCLQGIWFLFLVRKIQENSSYFYIGSMILAFFLVLFISYQRLVPEIKQFWMIMILLFPIFGFFFYVVFHTSRSFAKLRGRIKKEELVAQGYRYDDSKTLEKLSMGNNNAYSQIHYFSNVNFSVYEHCEVQYYSYGKDVYPDMLSALRKAKHFIFLEYFIISEGRMWEEIIAILKEKSQAGVEVKILYDDIGSVGHMKKDYISSLASYNIQMMSFFPKTFSLATDNRNHRKTLIVDGEVAFTGGINIADECLEETKKYGIWKDSSIQVKGEAVFEFTKMFLVMWKANIDHKLKQNMKSEQNYDHYKAKSKQYQCSGYMIPYHHNPFNQERVASRVYLNIMNQSTKYLYIFTPYLILDYSMKEALLLAAKRGVEIKIVTPGIPDKKLVYQVTRSYYKELLTSGIKIYEYIPGFLHAKCFLSDDLIATVGAVNLDYRSLYTHFENGCYFYQGEIIETMKQDFFNTLKDSREVTLADVQSGFFKKMWETFLNLFSPLL